MFTSKSGEVAPAIGAGGFIKDPLQAPAKLEKYGKADDPSTWSDVAETKDLVHLVVITRDEEIKAPNNRDSLD